MKKAIILSDYIKIADIHATRLKEALKQSSYFMPLSPEHLEALPITQLAILDTMTMRFSKLQDVIGSKIFALILDALKEEEGAFIDKLNRLEKLGYIDSANWWVELREIRNQVMHDYPGDYAIIVAHLVVFIEKINELLLFWDALKLKMQALQQ